MGYVRKTCFLPASLRESLIAKLATQYDINLMGGIFHAHPLSMRQQDEMLNVQM